MQPSRVSRALCSAMSQRRFQSSHILVGLSATQFGDLAVEQAVRMSKDGDTVTGFFVPPLIDEKVFPPAALAAMKERKANQQKDVFERANQAASKAKAKYSTKATFQVKELTPSENRRRAIVDACTTLKADVLVLGALGAGAVRRGEDKVPFDEQKYQQYYNTVASTPDFAMHNAPCPVFIVRPKGQ